MLHSDGMKTFTRSLLDQYDKIRGKDKTCLGSPFWDVIVITTADDDQKTVFEKQIKDKLQRTELPLNLPFHVISDQPGPKLGNGGSTLTAVQFLHKTYGDDIFKFRVLLIHAGGQSQRMPSASVLGKVFSPIPKGNPMYQMLDVKLAMFWPLVVKMSPGIFVTCADDFLVYDLGEDFQGNDSLQFSGEGFTVLAHPSTVSLGTTHGVYVIKDQESLDPSILVQKCGCLEVFQKPSATVMQQKGAILDVKAGTFSDVLTDCDKMSYTDSSFFFGHDVTKKFLGYIKANGMVACEIDAYGDFLQALGERATVHYVHNISNVSTPTPDLIETRTKIFNLLQGTDISVLVLNKSKFIHTGTTMEYINHFCNDHTFRDELGLSSDVFNLWTEDSINGNEPENKKLKLSHMSDTSLGCVMHSALPSLSNIQAYSVVEYCHFNIPVNVGQYCIVSNCEFAPDRTLSTSTKEESVSTSITEESVNIPNNLFLHTVPITVEGQNKYVTVFFDIRDNLKKAAPNNDLKSLPFLGKLVGDYSTIVDLDLSYICSTVGDTGTKVNLWHSALFPVTMTMSESLDLALKCVDAVKRDKKGLVSLKSVQTVSMHQILQMKDVDAMLLHRNTVYKRIMAGSSN